VTNDIVGTWRLVRVSATAADGSALPTPYGGDKAMGRLVLGADGRMMAVTCDGRTELPAGEAREYSSYCGNYSFDGQRLVTRVDAASEPGRIGSDQVREVRFEGNFMVLRPPLRPYGGMRQQRELYWERIAKL
jgi:Lipocalin-like domain